MIMGWLWIDKDLNSVRVHGIRNGRLAFFLQPFERPKMGICWVLQLFLSGPDIIQLMCDDWTIGNEVA